MILLVINSPETCWGTIDYQ